MKVGLLEYGLLGCHAFERLLIAGLSKCSISFAEGLFEEASKQLRLAQLSPTLENVLYAR